MANMQERECGGSEWLAVPRVGLDIIVKFQDDSLLNRSQGECTLLFVQHRGPHFHEM